jgi:alpha-tubulin suppressor-like RCC1 family protein
MRLLAMVVLSACATACGGGAKGAGQAGQAASPAAAAEARADDRGAPAGAPASVVCGDFSTCATTHGGEVRCWGRDKEGELGGGGGPDRPEPVAVEGLARVSEVALASHFACALLADASVACWGSGLLANDGRRRDNARPTKVAGLAGALQISASGAVACARAADRATCWGADPATLGAPPKGALTKVSAGFTHACGLDAKGAVSCWGSGDWAAKGALSRPPVTGARDLVTGDRHACVVTKDKKVQCWGMDDAGQLGTKPDIDTHPKPVTVPGIEGALALAAGEASTCALLEGGGVACWGANAEGELGLGTRSSDERPTKVRALAKVRQVCLGTTHGCALTKDSELLCWGANSFGQLGDGTTERRLVPTPVKW